MRIRSGRDVLNQTKKILPTTDYTIVGAGIMGLTIAYSLLKRDSKASITIFEKEETLGCHASGRNSGVLHSGIYYKPDTLKARFCSEGAALMKEFADCSGIPYLKTGKLIVATSREEEPILDTLLDNAKQSEIRSTYLVGKALQDIEPYVNLNYAGIHVPDTAVIDSRKVLEALCALLQEKGVRFYFGEPVGAVDPGNNELETPHFQQNFRFLFNCAGAYADRLAKKFGIADRYVLIPFKGLYMKLAPEKNGMVKGNIYPVPDLRFPFLGVHLTRSIEGSIYVGPTAIPALGRENYGIVQGLKWDEAFETLFSTAGLMLNDPVVREYSLSELKKHSKRVFFSDVKKLVPSLEFQDLVRSKKVGIRPQLANRVRQKIETDFIVERLPTSVHVLNAISPAFTSSFAFSKALLNW